jgi:environmental stress-induced protein Ves
VSDTVPTEVKLLRPADYRRMAWKNGGGITTEIARAPETADTFDWRISIAEIAVDGDFSIFPEVDRQLMLLDGGGIDLVIGSDEPLRLERRYQKCEFPGEAPVSCRLVDGPTRDFNVMVRRGTMRAEVIARTVVGPLVLFGEADTHWVVHVVSGALEVRDMAAPKAHAGDTLVITLPPGAAHRLVLSGSGESVLVKLVRVGT